MTRLVVDHEFHEWHECPPRTGLGPKFVAFVQFVVPSARSEVA